VSQSTASRAERGWLKDLSLRTIRALFTPLEARIQLAPRWKGAEVERLLDEDHSVVLAEVARRLEALGWLVEVEVTYSEYGERGSIDVLGVSLGYRPADCARRHRARVASGQARLERTSDRRPRLDP
jgi:hypothetical protein